MTATPQMVTAPRSAVRPLMIFAAVAVLGGGALLALSRLATPGEPFLLAAVYGTLLLPALLLARAERGPGGIRDLLRQAIQLPRPLLVAARRRRRRTAGDVGPRRSHRRRPTRDLDHPGRTCAGRGDRPGGDTWPRSWPGPATSRAVP